MSDLTIYKASAGSGKTFQLAREYLLLIFKPGTSFTSILAVTFTNKATGEMRDRILKELYILANGKQSDHAQVIAETYNYDANELQKKANHLLKGILHNYSRFNISTIDSFFQIILKSFTREIGLNVGFSLELNKKQLLEISIDQLFEKIQDNKGLNKWLSNYAIQKIEQGKSWDIQQDVLKFTDSAFGELFFSLSKEELEQFSNIDNLKDYKKSLTFSVDAFLAKLHKIGADAEQALQKSALSVDDFSYKKNGVVGFLIKQKGIFVNDVSIPGKRAETALQTEDYLSGWASKTAKNKAEIQGCVQAYLHPLLAALFQHFEQDYEEFITATLILKNIDDLAIIVEVFNLLIAYCNEKNIFLLPLASPLLAKMIGQDDAPFIYEKTGEYLKHFMVDEFQDTSQMQWNNFYPLFQNALAQEQKSLVVGDVKQSIYRWRNSDWSLLEHKLQQQFATFNPKEQILPNNWRSDENIVSFNNECFRLVANKIQQQINNEFSNFGYVDESHLIERIYETVEQQVPDKNKNTGGFVNAFTYTVENNKDSVNQAASAYVIQSLNQLFEANYQPRDIAILVRRNSEGATIAQALMDYAKENPDKAQLFDFVSNDSVFLGASTAVQLIIALLEFLKDGSDILNRSKVLQFYFAQQTSNQEAAIKLSQIEIQSDEAFFKELPEAFVADIDKLKEQSLVQLVSTLIQLFIFSSKNDFVSKQLPFLNSFQDTVLNYTKSSGTDISGFIEWWYEYGIKTPINLSEEQNAIRIVTVHKSKGLEYKAVIIPFVNWSIDQMPTLMWCKPSTAPFNKLSMVPVLYSSKMANSYFKQDYLLEKLMAAIDSLNVLYVAYTRAKSALFLGLLPENKKGELKSVSDAMQLFFNNIDQTKLRAEDVTINEEQGFSFGKLEKQVTKEYMEGTTLSLSLPTFNKNQLKIRVNSANSIAGDALSGTQKGKILHKILESVYTLNDVEPSINKLVKQGAIAAKDEPEYVNFLIEKIRSVEANKWFTNDWKVLNEYSILLPDGSIRRPDRVLVSSTEIIVIDYKFTTDTSSKHTQQVKNYMNLVSKMDSRTLKGYVWYLYQDKIVKVG